MPIGGIGAGCVCLNGYGGLQDFSIWNRPVTTALPEGFACVRCRLRDSSHQERGRRYQIDRGSIPGFENLSIRDCREKDIVAEASRGFRVFRNVNSKGNIHSAKRKISDPSIPLQVTVTAWNPFIPLDDKNSGIPCAILEYTLTIRQPGPSSMSSPITCLTWRPDVTAMVPKAGIP